MENIFDTTGITDFKTLSPIYLIEWIIQGSKKRLPHTLVDAKYDKNENNLIFCLEDKRYTIHCDMRDSEKMFEVYHFICDQIKVLESDKNG